MPWHYEVSRQSEYVKRAETHRQRFKHKWYSQYEAKTNSEIFQNHALDIMSRMTEPHVAMPAKQQSFVSTNITIIVIHPVQNCRNMVVNYVLHPHDIIMERYAYKKHRRKTDSIPGGSYPDLHSKVAPSWMTDQVKLRCHGKMNKLLLPSIVYYKSDFAWTPQKYDYSTGN